MNSDSDVVITVLKFALWPLVALVAIVLLRRPIGELLSRRVSKLSVFAVSVELAQVPEARPAWTMRLGNEELDFRGLTGADKLTDSYTHSLFRQMEEPGALDFATIDLGVGESWLTTRLFLFALLLERLRGLRCLVFVHTDNDIGQIFLGIAAPVSVRRALTSAYPWLDAGVAEATWDAIPKDGPTDAARPRQTTETYLHAALTGPAAQGTASAQAAAFLRYVQTETDPSAYDWLPLKTKAGEEPRWEHAVWVKTEAIFNGVLRDAVRQDACVVDQPGWKHADRLAAVLAKEGEFVALLADHPRGRFSRLIDRAALLDRVARARCCG